MNTGALNLKNILEKLFLLILPLGSALVFIITPIYWCVNTSLKTELAVISRPIQYLPSPATFENFTRAWRNVGFNTFFLNSLVIATTVMLLLVVFSMLIAYPMTRYKFSGKPVIVLILLCTQFLPRSMMLIPLFMTFKTMGLINSPMSLVLSYLAFELPFNAVLMIGFMSGIPIELDEAAMIDGCNRLQTVTKVLVPILIPGIVVAGSFAFIDSWKEFLFALMFINEKAKLTIPVGLSYMLGEYGVNYGTLAAGCIIAVIPPVLLFCYVQKYLVTGLSSGAVKG